MGEVEEAEDVVLHLFSSPDGFDARVQKGDASTATEVPNKRRQKLQITPPMCNYANVLLTTSTLLTLKGTFVR